MAGLSSGLRTFWHAMTSNDRHATHDSPYRTFSDSAHQPLSGAGRSPGLTSVVSPTETNLPYRDEDNHSNMALNTNVYNGPRSPANGSAVNSPSTPYSPGMRSASAAAASAEGPNGGIALQEFSDGVPPAPPVGHSWNRIDTWAESNYPELLDQLCTPASVNDINELEYSLDCSLPLDVRESWEVHDGQERGGRPTGIIFGCMLMDCEEILDEWKNWRVVEQQYFSPPGSRKGSSADASLSAPTGAPGRSELQARQDCHPEGSVQKVYSHAGWIPLARDWGGNYIAVDLAPAPSGTWGQIIIAGRDYDCKYVVAKSWAHFLAMVVDDMQSSHWYVDEDSLELKLKDPRAPRAEPTYLEILRVRNERKYGRKRIFRRPGSRPGSNPSSVPGSPHLSAVPNGTGHRGGLTRSLKQESPLSENHLKPPSKKTSKPLRSVSEEPAMPIPLRTTEGAKPAAGSSLIDDLEESTASLQLLSEVKLDDDEPSPLKRTSSDLLSQPPAAAVKSET